MNSMKKNVEIELDRLTTQRAKNVSSSREIQSVVVVVVVYLLVVVQTTRVKSLSIILCGSS